MKQPDHKRAQRLLKIKSEGAKFRWSQLYQAKILWIAIIVISILIYFSLTSPETDLALHHFIWLCAGILIGRILRDLIWLKDVVDAFPFLSKVLDWKKVEEYANNKDEQDHRSNRLNGGGS